MALAILLDILVGVLSALVFVLGTINIIGFFFQVSTGEEKFWVKLSTVLSMAGVVLFGLSELVDFAFESGIATVLRKVLVAAALSLVLVSLYLGLRKHALRYLGRDGSPMKVTFGGTEVIRKKMGRAK